jgi:hypothetical protein
MSNLHHNSKTSSSSRSSSLCTSKSTTRACMMGVFLHGNSLGLLAVDSLSTWPESSISCCMRQKRSASGMGNYFEYCVDVVVVAKHSLDEDPIVIVKIH